MIFLTEPSTRYKEQFISAVQEFQREGCQQDYDVLRISADFEKFVQRLQEEKDRRSVSPGFVPASTFWLIDDTEYIGRLSLRHELNDRLLKMGGHIGYEIRPSMRRQGYGQEILRLGLEKARALGLSRVLVTCDEDNIGSKKIIEHNGGQFENSVEVEGSPKKKLRYWIDIL